MARMQDYARHFPPRPPAKPPRKPFPLFLLLLPLLAAVTFFAARYLIIQMQDVDEPSAAAVQSNSTAVALPVPTDDYDFYSTLTKEQAVRLNQDAPPQATHQRYYILVEHFAAYGKALARSEEIKQLDMGPKINIKVEPYSSQGELVFRVRIGPYASRLHMNAARGRLYDKEIPHRVLVRPKT